MPRRASVPAAVHDPRRLRAVAASGLLDTGPDEAFDRLARLAATVLDAPLVFVTVVDERRSFWKACIGVDAPALKDRQRPVEESFCRLVVGTQEPVIVGDTASDPRTRDKLSVELKDVRACAGFPLHAPGGEVLGSFCVMDTRLRDWSAHDGEVLRTLAAAAAGEVALRSALENEHRLREATELEAERSATLARTLQQSLLPPSLPRVPGLDVAARYEPGGRGVDVVGDFYDVFQSSGERWNLVIGDVCGKGIEAARVTMLARYTLRAVAMHTQSPREILAALNEALVRASDALNGRFLTAAVVSVTTEGDRARVVLSSGGHMPTLLRSASGHVRPVGRGGTILGIFPDVALIDEELMLAPGDALILYTDGVTEARRDSVEFGEDRLKEVIAATPAANAAGVAEAVAAAVAAYRDGDPTDDTAVLVVRVPG